MVALSIHTGRMTVPQAAWLYEDRAHMSQAAAKAESDAKTERQRLEEAAAVQAAKDAELASKLSAAQDVGL